MKGIFICVLVILSTYKIFSKPGEIWFHIDDNTINPTPTYFVKAIRISNSDPLFGANFMEVDSYDYNTVISDYDALNEEPIGIFEYQRGFDYLRDPDAWPNIGEGKLRFEIYRNDVIKFQFSIDLVSSNGSPDISFEFHYVDDNNISMTGTGSGGSAQTIQIINNSFVNCWDFHGQAEPSLTYYTNTVTLINEIAGLVENNIKTTFNSATMGFPYNDVQLGFQYSPGTPVRLWRGVKYNISTSHTSYIKNGTNYNFRNWNNYESYGSSSTLKVLSNTDEFRSMYYPTIPLTIANNLEGGSSNDDFELTWQTPPTSQNWQFGATYNAFIFQDPRNDRYTATAPNSFQALGTTWWFQNWEDGSDYNVKSNIQVTSPTTYTAYYKGHFRSDFDAALSNGSQRRLVRTDNGIYHLVYESMGWTWYTYSLTTDFNGQWSDEQSIWGINPSMDFEGNIVKIVTDCQLGFDVGIVVYTFKLENGHYVLKDQEEIVYYDLSYYGNAKPVIAYNYQKLFIAYRKNNSDGIYQKTKWFNPSTSNWYWTNETLIPNTSSSSINPSIAGKADALLLAYQDSYAIQFKYGYWQSHTHTWSFSNESQISTGSGFAHNYSPSICRTDSYYPVVCWIGDIREESGGGGITKINSTNEAGSPEPQAIVRVGSFTGSNWGSFLKLGDNVISTNNNSLPESSNQETIITWSEGSNPNFNSKWVRRAITGCTDAHALSSNGKQIQVSNGTSYENIGGVVFTTATTPYNLALTTTDFNQEFTGGGITKIKDNIELGYGREGIIVKNGIEFLFDIGDVIVSDSAIKFISCPDTIAYNSAAELNNLVRTEAFNLDPSSEFYFTDFYYVLHKEEADSLLTEDDMVNFKAELVSEQTGEVVGTFDDITYTKQQLEGYDNVSYRVDCSNITSGNYYLRLVTSVQGGAGYYLGNVQNGSEELNKKNYNQINFDGSKLPVTYDLSQNYPNPFNPTTTINYQIPRSEFVTLKVYDILGKEIATLVNEQKIQGRYSVKFNASSAAGGLASGVYIYQIRANDYVSSKKMLLLK